VERSSRTGPSGDPLRWCRRDVSIAVPAYAGIPLTHRDFTATVAFVTGTKIRPRKHQRSPGTKLQGIGTLCFSWGRGNFRNRSKPHGPWRSPDTPVAVIRAGTVPEQRTVTGSLENIAEMAQKRRSSRCIIVVGDCVRLRRTSTGSNKGPFLENELCHKGARTGKRFCGRLCELGAECIEFPTIELIPPPS